MALTNLSFIVAALWFGSLLAVGWLSWYARGERDKRERAVEIARIRAKQIKAEQERPGDPAELADRVRKRL